MTSRRTIDLVVGLLGAVTILGVGFIGALAFVERAIPDAMIAVTTGSLGALGGILAKTSSSDEPITVEQPVEVTEARARGRRKT